MRIVQALLRCGCRSAPNRVVEMLEVVKVGAPRSSDHPVIGKNFNEIVDDVDVAALKAVQYRVEGAYLIAPTTARNYHDQAGMKL